MQTLASRSRALLASARTMKRGFAEAAAAASQDKLSLNFFLPNNVIKEAAEVVRRLHNARTLLQHVIEIYCI